MKEEECEAARRILAAMDFSEPVPCYAEMQMNRVDVTCHLSSKPSEDSPRAMNSVLLLALGSCFSVACFTMSCGSFWIGFWDD